MFRTPIILAMSLLFCTGVQATVFKISTEYPDGNAVLNELRAVGERIEAQTEGRVTFKFYPGGVITNLAFAFITCSLDFYLEQPVRCSTLEIRRGI